MNVASTRLLVRAGFVQLVRTPRAWTSAAMWTAFAIVAALVAKSGGVTSGATHVLRGSFADFVLPFVSFSVVGAAVGEGGLARSVRGYTLLGAGPRDAGLARVLVAIVASSLVCAVLAASVCLLAHGATDPPLIRDLPASFGVGALGGAAYGAFFSVGSAVGKGGLRGFLLAFDWLTIGTSLEALVPRGHVASLLGGPPCADLSPRVSSAILLLLGVAYLALAALVMPRRPRPFERP